MHVELTQRMLTVFKIDNLNERTGATTMVVMTRGTADVDDTVVPAILGSNDAQDFIPDVLKMEPNRLMNKFEVHVVEKAEGKWAIGCVGQQDVTDLHIKLKPRTASR